LSRCALVEAHRRADERRLIGLGWRHVFLGWATAGRKEAVAIRHHGRARSTGATTWCARTDARCPCTSASRSCARTNRCSATEALGTAAANSSTDRCAAFGPDAARCGWLRAEQSAACKCTPSRFVDGATVIERPTWRAVEWCADSAEWAAQRTDERTARRAEQCAATRLVDGATVIGHSERATSRFVDGAAAIGHPERATSRFVDGAAVIERRTWRTVERCTDISERPA
jgi:hypothetical protein